ncbi:hypothetical protein [Pseudoflavonifractor sp. An184]|uniref:hypothetical protein n=1 Tax=Pseudoflavonifractor sp. An184 TaxID=1965576 RepID=UPI000B36DA3E|nr:hypothetical protein [Pseudoflavonifractor sp. An184]OUP56912.1 hypothetical protein B5F19_05225 [Pseudoflavonifractor sp. An184]
MYNQTNLAVAEEQDIVFRFPDVDASADFSKEDMEDDIDGLHLSFPRAKIAGGGTTVFELPSDDASKPEHVGKLEGVILFHHPVNGYWVGDSADEDNAPLCTSMDGKTGYGEPGGACAQCYLNRFGSSEDGRGKACKNQRCLYLLRDGEFMPIQLYLPPTSLKAFSQFMNIAFLRRNRASYGSVVELTLHREEKPKPHAVVDFRKVRDFVGVELAQAKAYSNAFRNQTKKMLEERVQIIKDQQDDGCDYDGFGKKGKNGGFVIQDGVSADEDLGELPL